MGYSQLRAPNPNIPCRPGWCLAYVNEAFGVPKIYGSATAAWEGSTTKHRDRNFPAGVAVPVWYGLDTTPLGHVVIRMPDGSVYSTSDLTNVPHHHPDLADLERYYAYYGMNLTYRGWTEDVEGTLVVAGMGLAAQADTITPITEDILDMASQDELNRLLRAADRINGRVKDVDVLNAADGAYMNMMRDAQHAAVMGALGKTLDKADGGYIVRLIEATKPGATDPQAIADFVIEAVGKDLAKEVLDGLGARLKEN